MDQHGLSRADLVLLLGTPSRVSEVLNGKCDLSMSMVRKLRERFAISADLLIAPGDRWDLRPSSSSAAENL
jgi:HTH-type transcriptional regulator/antitoxin HigA